MNVKNTFRKYINNIKHNAENVLFFYKTTLTDGINVKSLN